MKRIVREPLIHFLILGAALFAVAHWMDDGTAPSDNRIVVQARKIDQLAALFARTWQRPPTQDELKELVDDYVREEAAYREGVAMGLDTDDTIIRRRIRQKLDFIAEDLEGNVDPTEADLEAFLAAHPELFQIQPVLTFKQVYFSPEAHGDRLKDDVLDVVDALNGDGSIDIDGLGDRILLDNVYKDASTRVIANTFGSTFAKAIVELEPGAWHGPIESGYGVHAVLVEKRVEGRIPELDEVRDAVRQEWENARRDETIQRYYRDLLDRYEITIEWPQPELQGSGP